MEVIREEVAASARGPGVGAIGQARLQVISRALSRPLSVDVTYAGSR